MRKYSDRDFESLEKWAANPLASDERTSQWAMKAISSGSDSLGTPLLFNIQISENIIEYLIKNGVELDVRDSSGRTLLFYDTYLEEGVFDILADYFEAKSLIDAPDIEGFTALSHYVKFGDAKKSLALLQRGASPNSFAKIMRHGGARLSVAKQAILSIFRIEGEGAEDLKIELLSLLRKFGMMATQEEKNELLEYSKSLGYTKVEKWIIDNV